MFSAEITMLGVNLFTVTDVEHEIELYLLSSLYSTFIDFLPMVKPEILATAFPLIISTVCDFPSTLTTTLPVASVGRITLTIRFSPYLMSSASTEIVESTLLTVTDLEAEAEL